MAEACFGESLFNSSRLFTGAGGISSGGREKATGVFLEYTQYVVKGLPYKGQYLNLLKLKGQLILIPKKVRANFIAILPFCYEF